MLAHKGLLSVLNAKTIVLASKSPRRSSLLGQIGLRFVVRGSTFDEKLPKSKFAGPSEYVVETARHKAIDVWRGFCKENKKAPELLIAADTVVASPDGRVLEKPANADAAAEMLAELSGRQHTVVTGVVLLAPARTAASGDVSGLPGQDFAYAERKFFESTTVRFCRLDWGMIDSYVDSKEPMDKAGSYGIQGLGGTFVSGIDGDYYNVVGLPIHALCRELIGWWAVHSGLQLKSGAGDAAAAVRRVDV